MRKVLKWQKEFLEEMSRMDNDRLFMEFEFISGGDDYDNCFTKRGEWKYNEIRNELINRLHSYNFLSKEFGKD